MAHSQYTLSYTPLHPIPPPPSPQSPSLPFYLSHPHAHKEQENYSLVISLHHHHHRYGIGLAGNQWPDHHPGGRAGDGTVFVVGKSNYHHRLATRIGGGRSWGIWKWGWGKRWRIYEVGDEKWWWLLTIFQWNLPENSANVRTEVQCSWGEKERGGDGWGRRTAESMLPPPWMVEGGEGGRRRKDGDDVSERDKIW